LPIKGLRLAVVTLALSAFAVHAQDDKAPKREPKDPKVTDYRVDPDKDKLERTSAADAPKLAYVSAKRESSFDGAKGGDMHLKFASYVFVYPLEYKGETADGKYYVYQEKSPDKWWWYFAKAGSGGKYDIQYYAQGSLFQFDKEATRYPRTPAP
jgi:hypothetical protein